MNLVPNKLDSNPHDIASNDATPMLSKLNSTDDNKKGMSTMKTPSADPPRNR